MFISCYKQTDTHIHTYEHTWAQTSFFQIVLNGASHDTKIGCIRLVYITYLINKSIILNVVFLKDTFGVNSFPPAKNHLLNFQFGSKLIN